MIKKQARIIGIDDAPFDKRNKGRQVLVVGTIYRGGDYMDGLLSTKITIDGNDSTEKVTEMINKSKFRPQLQAVILDGIALGGFNIVDIKKLNEKTRLPVIVVIRSYPDFKKIFKALEKIGMKEKIKTLEELPKPISVGKVYIQHIGLSFEKAEEILKLTCTRSYLPEPIRIAHIIAAGVVKGESKGRV